MLVSVLIVVGNPKAWPLEMPNVNVVAARDYLTDPSYGSQRVARVYNFCNSYRYQSLGYYVSLQAEARGHRPLPRVGAIGDLQSQDQVRLMTSALEKQVAKSLAPIESDEFTLSIYFGRNVAACYDTLSRHIFDLFQTPLLRALFVRRNGDWHVRSVKSISAEDIPLKHQAFVVEAARRYFTGRQPRPRHRRSPRFDLAILHDRDNSQPASNDKALARFEKAAHSLGIETETVVRTDLHRLGCFDGLFIRDTTFLNHYTYQFSRRAKAQDLVVIDDPDSILHCNNKVYLAELLPRWGIPIPKTLLVHRGNIDQVIHRLGLPCILKQPDSSMSLGVYKATSAGELAKIASRLLEHSELIVAQEYLPTEFDWRVGILDRRPLFVCKYYMVPGHWQIIQHDATRQHYAEGIVVALPLQDAPAQVIRIALKAANLIGDGFYGVDIKQLGNRYCVIEVNDNPTVDAGGEDGVLKDQLYFEVMKVFARRMAARRECQP
jgi:glutathione synthase/RimK-type ligase-like ATP-grasp enzyme